MYEQRKTVRQVSRGGETIDLLRLAGEMWQILRRLAFRFILLFLCVSAGFTTFCILRFKPEYQSYVTYVVSRGTNSTEDVLLASRINSSFHYLALSTGIYSAIFEKFDIPMEDVSTASVSLSSGYTDETNFVTIYATSEYETQAIQAISVVKEYFPKLVRTVAVNVEYSIVDQSGSTDLQINSFSLPRFLALGIALGFFVDCAILFLMAYLSESVHSFEELRKTMNLLLVGSVPMTHLKKRKQISRSLLSLSNERLSEEFREAIYQARARIERQMKDKNYGTLLVTSSVAGEGKTTICTDLAIAMAERGERVLLIDADLRSPAVAECMGIKEAEHGIVEVLEQKIDYRDALIRIGDNKPDVLTGKGSVSETGKYLASKQMKQLLQTVSQIYDMVLIDTPPAAMFTDASILAKNTDAVIYVVRQDYTKLRSIEEGLSLVSYSSTDVLGCVFNCVEGDNSKYYYSKTKKKQGTYGYGHANQPAD